MLGNLRNGARTFGTAEDDRKARRIAEQGKHFRQGLPLAIVQNHTRLNR